MEGVDRGASRFNQYLQAVAVATEIVSSGTVSKQNAQDLYPLAVRVHDNRKRDHERFVSDQSGSMQVILPSHRERSERFRSYDPKYRFFRYPKKFALIANFSQRKRNVLANLWQPIEKAKNFASEKRCLLWK